MRELTPETSAGFAQAQFARETLRRPLDPWEEWLAIHAGELLSDGRPRFRVVIVLVARQNGKTEVLVILCLYWQFVDAFPLILGTSTKLEYAKESWQKSVALAEATEDFNDLRGPRKWTRSTNAQEVSFTVEGARYKIAASNEEGGRSLTINRLVCDELRQHHDYSAWGASEEATSAVWDAQIWGLSNAGDDRSVVLNDLRAEALRYIKTGEGDYRLGLFEWSAHEKADPRDIHALAQANPNLNRRKDGAVLLAKAYRAVRLGGEALVSFKTESMCINVPKLNPAIDPDEWNNCLDVGDLAGVRGRVALCLDVAPDGQHATLAAAAVLPDDRVRVEIVAAWSGRGCDDRAGRDLPGWLERIKPAALGWFPAGPAASLAATLADRKRAGWPPPGVAVEEIRGELAAVCMGLSTLITARGVAHSADPLLDAQLGAAERLPRGDAWVFARRRAPMGDGETADGTGHVDAVYAAAGAIHLARTLPDAPAPAEHPRVILPPR